MSFIEDFPHTSIYDKDLGWLIRQYKELNGNYEVLKDIYNIVKEQIHDVTIAQLQEWLDDGTLENILHSLSDIVTVYNTTDDLINSNLVENMIVKTFNNHGQDEFGSTYIISNIEKEDTFNVQLTNGLYANMIMTKTFYLEQIDSRDLDVILPIVLKSNMNIYLRNSKELSITYDENKYSDLKNVYIDFSNSKITVKTPYNKTHASIIKFYNCSNIEVVGGEFDGVCSMNLAINQDTEWCHCFTIVSTNNYYIRNMIIHDFCGDGIEIGNDRDLKYIEMSGIVRNIEVYNVHRNGISLLDGDNVLFDNIYCHNLSDLASNPINQPLSTIDCEPWYDQQHFNTIRLNNVKDESPGGINLYAIESSKKTYYFVENSILNFLRFNKFGELSDSKQTNYLVNNCHINIGLEIIANCCCNLNYSKTHNDYRALTITLQDSNKNKDFFINADINLVGNNNTQLQYVYCANNNSMYTSIDSVLNVRINTGYCDCSNFFGECNITNNSTITHAHTPLLTSFDSNFKKLIVNTEGTLQLGTSLNIYQPITLLINKNLSYSCINNDKVKYIGDASGSCVAGDVLQITPTNNNNNQRIYFISKL